jgi:hypothetical protein
MALQSYMAPCDRTDQLGFLCHHWRALMPMKARYLALLALAACTAPRPGDAYAPNYAATCDPKFDDCRDAGEQSNEPPLGDDAGDDVIVDPESDAGELPGDPDATVDPSNPRAALQGNYLVRMDYYSTATATQGVTTLKVANRVSNLFFVTLALDEAGQLKASEHLCFQNYFHKCLTTASCKDWETKVDTALPPFFQRRHQERLITLDDAGNLSTEQTLLPVGYDDENPNVSTIPSADALGTIWRLSDTDPNEIGVFTRITATLSSGLVNVSFKCKVASAQLFGVKFSGKLPKVDVASLIGLTMPIDTAGSGVKAVYAEPVDSASDPAQACNLDYLESHQPDAPEQGFVRFKKAGSFTDCPASDTAFDQAFPADPATR